MGGGKVASHRGTVGTTGSSAGDLPSTTEQPFWFDTYCALWRLRNKIHIKKANGGLRHNPFLR